MSKLDLGAYFWGTRGSLPTSPIQADIESVAEYIMNHTIRNKDLPPFEIKKKMFEYLQRYEYIGSNTSCIEIQSNSLKNKAIIFDAGTGIKWAGDKILSNNNIDEIHIFITHTHWDHISGFPFFNPIYSNKHTIFIYSPFDDVEARFNYQQDERFFPIPFKNLNANINFVVLNKHDKINIDDIKISFIANKHPGGSFSYKAELNDNSIVYMTDTELNFQNLADFREEFSRFISNVDMLIFDAQYTFMESCPSISDKAGWGHSSSIIGVEIANEFLVKHLVLCHFDPNLSSSQIWSNFNKAVMYKNKQSYKYPTHISNAKENCLIAV